jgi:hypothetical protein
LENVDILVRAMGSIRMSGDDDLDATAPKRFRATKAAKSTEPVTRKQSARGLGTSSVVFQRSPFPKTALQVNFPSS